LITCMHKIFNLKLDILNYRNVLKKPIYTNVFIKNKNIWARNTSEYIEEVNEKNDSVSLI
jgi:hypothetical protein